MKNPSPTLGYALVSKTTETIDWVGIERPTKGLIGISEWWFDAGGEQLVLCGWHKLVRVEIKPVAAKRK